MSYCYCADDERHSLAWAVARRLRCYCKCWPCIEDASKWCQCRELCGSGSLLCPCLVAVGCPCNEVPSAGLSSDEGADSADTTARGSAAVIRSGGGSSKRSVRVADLSVEAHAKRKVTQNASAARAHVSD
jgi:hypothetical protein